MQRVSTDDSRHTRHTRSQVRGHTRANCTVQCVEHLSLTGHAFAIVLLVFGWCTEFSWLYVLYLKSAECKYKFQVSSFITAYCILAPTYALGRESLKSAVYK